MELDPKKVFSLFLLVLGTLSTAYAHAGGYYGGRLSEEILLKGRVISAGIGEGYSSQTKRHNLDTPIMMVEYKNRLYRCHVTLDIDVDRPQTRNGFAAHCWSGISFDD